jgi:hypothetical protein
MSTLFFLEAVPGPVQVTELALAQVPVLVLGQEQE